MALLCVMGLAEWARLIGIEKPVARWGFVLANALLMAALWFWRAHDSLRIAMGIGVIWWAFAALWLRSYAFCQAQTARNVAIKAVAGTLTIVPAWAGAVLIDALPDRGHWWLLFVIVLIWCADIFAYLVGRKFGRTKLAPRISPGKSWQGVYGALIGSALFALAAGYVLNPAHRELGLLVLLSVVTVAISIVGDLFESLIKRHSQQKDSGSLFPGHGGMLDRLDSLFAALPVFACGKLMLAL
jgi:phosphatidate cytidylyltransferase